MYLQSLLFYEATLICLCCTSYATVAYRNYVYYIIISNKYNKFRLCNNKNCLFLIHQNQLKNTFYYCDIFILIFIYDVYIIIIIIICTVRYSLSYRLSLPRPIWAILRYYITGSVFVI